MSPVDEEVDGDDDEDTKPSAAKVLKNGKIVKTAVVIVQKGEEPFLLRDAFDFTPIKQAVLLSSHVVVKDESGGLYVYDVALKKAPPCNMLGRIFGGSSVVKDNQVHVIE